MKKINYPPIYMLFLLVFLLNACVKGKAEPPVDNSSFDPKIEVTHSIEDLQSMPFLERIEEDIVVAAYVIMNDKEENLFKRIIVQDETAGMEILLDHLHLHTTFPETRKIYIHLKGFFLNEQKGSFQLGYFPDDTEQLTPIPVNMIDDFITKANYPNEINIPTFSLSDLLQNDHELSINTLINIKGVEFTPDHAGVEWAVNDKSVTNRTIKDCEGNQLSVRTLRQASFSDLKTPLFNGTIQGVFSYYNHQAVLYIRNTEEVLMYDPRCDGYDLEPDDKVNISIDSLRKMYKGSALLLPPIKISGVVISDKSHGNVAYRNVVIQGGNEDKGIVLYYTEDVDYELGDSIEVDLTGKELTLYNNKLEVVNIEKHKTIIHAKHRTIIPKVVTINQLLGFRKNYESCLVQINNVNFQAGAPTYNGTNGTFTINDGTGTMNHYTAVNASFKDYTMPLSPVEYVRGIVEIHYQNVQLRIRYPNEPIGDVKP